MEVEILSKHPDYEDNVGRWEFFLRSYLGGDEYKNGSYLTKYVNEDNKEYGRRIEFTPVDNHCKNVVNIYSSYLWRVPPVRNFNSLDNNYALIPFLKDADFDGRSFNAFMREAQIWSSIYGHSWIILDKPKSTAGTRAEELAQEIRPYVNLFTPENVFDWRWDRAPSGRYILTYLKVREAVVRHNATDADQYFREWTPEEIKYSKVSGDAVSLIESIPNPLGVIPAVFLPAARSSSKGIGISDLTDIATMQKSIYQELSEIEQLIRISNHPTLVKTNGTDASAGAGSIVTMPDDLDPNLKPYQIQPDGGNLDAIRESIKDKVAAINRMAHLGAIRGTEAVTASGIALQTEFQLLNARLAEKADFLELAEEQLWSFFCRWQGITPDVEVFYADSFDIRDYPQELQFLQAAKSSGVRSITLMREIDKRIADLVLDDEDLKTAYSEIVENTQALGDFSERTQIYAYHMDAGVVTPNEVREKIGLEKVPNGDTLLARADSNKQQ